MPLTASSDDNAVSESALSPRLMAILALACGLIVANIYYAQPLVGPISAALGLPVAAAGLIVTMTQLGYGAGLLLVVPLGDLFENRRLILCVTAICTLALAAAALSTHAAPFLLASLLIGIGSVSVQILVPFAAHLAPEAVRGRVVGNVMGGLMLGIMLARPAASFLTALWCWQAIFVLSALLMVALSLVLAKTLPRREPTATLAYGGLLLSMAHLARTTPVLRRRSLYQACLFGAFSLFWTTTPLLLAGVFHLSQAGIALFALAGVAGAVAAPVAGRLADRGWSRPASGLAIGCVAAAFLLTHLVPGGSKLALAMLVLAAIVLDFGVSASLVLGQRAIYALGAETRGRLTGVYMATFFVGGALGSAFGAWAYARGGWTLASWGGLALPALALLYYCGEFRRRRA